MKTMEETTAEKEDVGIVFRASGIGHPCSRRIWLQGMGVEEKFSPKTLRIFDMGHALESVVLKWLQQDGWVVESNPGSQDAEMEVTVPFNGGVIAGHPDAIIRNDNIEVLVDVKTMNHRQYGFWKKNGTVANKPQYVIQTTIYAGALKIPNIAIAAVDKDNADYDLEILPYNQKLMDVIIARAERIAQAKFLEDIPIGACQIDVANEQLFDGPLPAWCCSYCGYCGEFCDGD